ncbi:angiotensin-converting enzyme-like [Odontomachus brunneus]|uniref:angiotensin-converting enzyme-like n=1 Tax=Odontomachus brunneus TaxID=486640 RepID=UPI0013F1C407|nr:angiotensin-converting enzyme-like [Odontomachus brunneus]XP_032689503.1 angiotensin-converting enzyme-like [Odontomachus brunneus]
MRVDMLRLISVAALIIALVVAESTNNDATTTENPQSVDDILKVRRFLKKADAELEEWYNEQSIVGWNYASNLTEENLATKLNVSVAMTNVLKNISKESLEFLSIDIEEEDIKRQIQKLATLGAPMLSEEMQKEFEATISQMENIYSTAKICDYENRTKCDLALEPEITEILMYSRNPEELKHIWVEWRKVSGEKVKSLYSRYVELANDMAKLYNFSDYAAYWMKDYETDNFPEQIETLWQQLKPLYLQLHAYVRRELRKKYGEDIVSKDGPIPAHLLGNMWAQSWANIADFTIPFPGKQLPDVSNALVEQGYNTTSIFRLAESFFTSINLTAMPDLFWEKSILTKQEDVDMICHASAWDFYDGKDFRIKQCTRINMEDLLTAHHEMGHIEYYLQYKDQPTIFKQGANPGFHEAVGDVIALSASNPSHLKKIGLLQDDSTDPEAVLNNLYVKSLEKIAFLPFAYMLDRWRWNVFQGKVTPDNYNCDWWSLAEEYQGIEPPVDRSEEDFDPGSKYHVVADVEYIRYYVSFVIQFQFHKALCTEAKQYDPKNPEAKPLHQCDIYENKDAGNLLKSMLELGFSKPWPDAMEKITKQRQMDSAGLLEYFKPLIDWLTEENKKTNEYIGWTPSNKKCVQTRGELRVIEEPTE